MPEPRIKSKQMSPIYEYRLNSRLTRWNQWEDQSIDCPAEPWIDMWREIDDGTSFDWFRLHSTNSFIDTSFVVISNLNFLTKELEMKYFSESYSINGGSSCRLPCWSWTCTSAVGSSMVTAELVVVAADAWEELELLKVARFPSAATFDSDLNTANIVLVDGNVWWWPKHCHHLFGVYPNTVVTDMFTTDDFSSLFWSFGFEICTLQDEMVCCTEPTNILTRARDVARFDVIFVPLLTTCVVSWGCFLRRSACWCECRGMPSAALATCSSVELEAW